MSKDRLAEATRALRETEAASELEARATRTRVITGLHQTRVKRRTRLAFVLPIAATFAAASAWGAASGEARRMLDRIEGLVGASSVPASTTPLPKRAPLRALPAAKPEPLPTPTEATEPKAQVEPKPAAVALPSALRAAPSASTRQLQASDPALDLYRAAHTAHFVDHDPARALAAWDAYLAAAPNGQLAPEARYNRALSYVRLGRVGEARAALEPFAAGAYGGYRKLEARALLDGLGE